MEPVLFFDRAMLGHDPGPTHPESPERLRAIEAALSDCSAAPECAAEATAEVLRRVHAEAYVAKILALRDEETSLDPDTHVSPGSVRAALLAAGSAVESVDHAIETRSDAFALVRPPGHHAEHDRAMGFCLFNNIAVAAAHARAVHGIERILILDWDVHHGNGTEHAFARDNGVLFASMHQHPLYPGSGAVTDVGSGDGRGFTVNLPFGAGCTDADYTRAFDEVLLPIAEQYRPQLVLVSAGFDAHRDDPIGGMRLTDEGFAALCGRTRDLARRSGEAGLVMLLEGGYDVLALASSVSGCIRVLRGETAPSTGREVTNAGERTLTDAARVQSAFWTLD